MMVDFKWIQISLFLVVEFQFTAAAEQLPLSSTVRVGDEVTLSCKNVMNGQQNCDATKWLYSDSPTIAVVELGKIVEGDKSKSDRLSVTGNCSLVIKNVTVQDVGRYTCRQFNKSGQEQGPGSEVDLSVVTMTEQKDNDEVTLSCSVSTYEPCRLTVKWLFQDRDVDKESKDVKTSQSLCSASVNFKTSHFIYTSKFEPLKCEVTDGDKVKFPFRLQPSGEETTATKPATPEPTTTDDPSTVPTGCSAVNYIMLVLRVAELVLITVITVLLIRAPGNQRPPDDNTLSNPVRRPPVRRSGAAASQVNDDEDEDDGVVNYENSVRLR